MGSRVVMKPDLRDKLMKDAATALLLREVAEKAARKVKVPSSMKSEKEADERIPVISTRAGIGPHGAFAQVIMRGPGAIIVEFGSRYRKPLSPLRTAIYSMKGVKAGGR